MSMCFLWNNLMKIVHALYSDRKGGLEQAFVNITKMLLSLNYEVELWVPSGAPYTEHLVSQCTKVDLKSKGYYDVFSAIRNHKALKYCKPDLIITHNSRATTMLTRARVRLGIPHVAFSHGYKTRRFNKVDHLVTLTDDMKSHFISAGYYPENISVFPNVIESVPDLKVRSIPVRENSLRLGFLGRLNQEKGLEDLLYALALLKDRFQIELHIAGSGVDQKLIEGLAKKLNILSHLHFCGWVDDKVEWFSNMDFAVFPSRYEPFGIVVLEASSYGCPVISTNVAGPASQILSGFDGWLAEANSPKSLACTIETAILSIDKWQKIRVEAHKRAKKYLMSNHVNGLKKIVEGCVNDRAIR